MNDNLLNYRLRKALFILGASVLTSVFAYYFIQPSTTAQEVKVYEAKPSVRHQRGLQVVGELSNNAGQPALNKLQKEFPFLADATVEYALGDVWGRKVLDPKTRQIAAISAFAAQGTLPQMKIHARYALNLGVTREELKEVIYLTTVHAGFPRALNAAEALQEVFEEADKKPGQKR